MSDAFTFTSDAREDQTAADRDAQREKALEFARLYQVFKDDPRAEALLKHWTEAAECRDIPPGASHQEYAYWESRRAFIQGINRQLKFAQTDGRM